MKKRHMFLGLAVLLLLGHVVAFWASYAYATVDPDAISGFRGNVIAGFVGSLMFLLLGLYLDDEVGRLTEETHRLSAGTHGLTSEMAKVTAETKRLSEETNGLVSQTHGLSDQTNKLVGDIHQLSGQTKKLAEETNVLAEAEARRVKTQQRIDGFLRFFHRESYHDVTFEDLKTPHHKLGLVYTICPLRDEKGQPRVYRTEMSELYIVRVQKIAFEDVLEPEERAEYDGSPIRVGAAYFCEYVNDAWHMGLEDFSQPHKFYLSNKQGMPTPGVTADEIVGDNKPPNGGTLVCKFVVDRDGAAKNHGIEAKVYKAGSGMYLMLSDSPMKAIDYNQKPWGVEDIEGYFESTEAKERFRATLVQQVEGSGKSGVIV